MVFNNQNATRTLAKRTIILNPENLRNHDRQLGGWLSWTLGFYLKFLTFCVDEKLNGTLIALIRASSLPQRLSASS